MIRGTSLTGFPALVTELGGDPDVLLSRAGIQRSDVGRFDAFFTYLAFINVVEAAATTTKTPAFGRLLGERQGIEILGPVRWRRARPRPSPMHSPLSSSTSAPTVPRSRWRFIGKQTVHFWNSGF